MLLAESIEKNYSLRYRNFWLVVSEEHKNFYRYYWVKNQEIIEENRAKNIWNMTFFA